MTNLLDDSKSATLGTLLNKRHSCRAYLPRQVSRATINEVLKLAQKTPSWCNSQPWQLIITTGEGTERFRQRLLEAARGAEQPETDFPFPAQYVGVYKDRQRECGWQLYASLGIAKGDRDASGRQVLENFRFFGAPHVAIITTEAELGVYGALDCGCYITSFLLAATSMGLGTIAQAALAQRSDFIRDYFELPSNRKIVCGISFGYPDPNHPANSFRTRREDIAEVATFIES